MVAKIKSFSFWANSNVFELGWLVFLGILMFSKTSDTDGFVISGKIKDQNNKMVFLSISISPGRTVKDSAKIVDDHFSFKGEVAEPAPATIKIEGSDSGLELFLDNSDIEVDASNGLDKATVTGCKENDLYTSFNKTIKPYVLTEQDIDSYSKYEAAKDSASLKKMQSLFDDKEIKRIAAVKQFVAKNPDSKASAYAMILYLSDLPYQELQDVYTELSPRVKDSGYGKYLQRHIAKLEKSAVGHQAEDFVQTDANGNPVHLSSFRGQYLLIDFWASWCEPCRLANPHLVSLFQKYSGKGFNILGVAFEQPGAKNNWIKAITDDKLSWTNVSDFKYLRNDVAVQYGISNIPANLLLDKDGKIIAKNLSADELQKKLAELLN